MTAPARRRIRVLAVSTLAALGGAALCVWLTFAFPYFETHFNNPPQTWLPVLLVPTSVALALATCISGLNQSRRARQPLWIGTFTVVLLLLLLGPIYLICGVLAVLLIFARWYFFMPSDPHIFLFLAACSAALLVLTAICALLYAWRASSPNALLQGKT